MGLDHFPVLFDGPGLEPHFDAQEHLAAAVRAVFLEIVIDIEQEHLRIGGIVPIPVFRQDDPDPLGFGRCCSFLEGLFRIAGIICMGMGIKQHGHTPLSVRYTLKRNSTTSPSCMM